MWRATLVAVAVAMTVAACSFSARNSPPSAESDAATDARDSQAARDAASDLFLWLPFDEGTGATSFDAVKHHPATLGTGATWVPGHTGSAIRVDGTAQGLVNLARPMGSANLGPMTVMVWVRAMALGGTQRVVAKEQQVTGTDVRWNLDVTSTGAISFVRSYSMMELERTSNTLLNLGEWHHVALTWNDQLAANGVRLYRDGVEVAYQTQTDAMGTKEDDSAIDLFVGNVGDGSRGFVGDIDDVRIYTRVLASAEIKAIAGQ